MEGNKNGKVGKVVLDELSKVIPEGEKPDGSRTFEEYGLSIIDLLELHFRIEKRLGVMLPVPDIKHGTGKWKFKTSNDVINYITRNLS